MRPLACSLSLACSSALACSPSLGVTGAETAAAPEAPVSCMPALGPLSSYAALGVCPEDGQPGWVERQRTAVTVGGARVVLVQLDWPGVGAGLAFVREDGPRLALIGAFGVEHGGNGVDMEVTSLDVRGATATVRLHIVRHSRGFYLRDGPDCAGGSDVDDAAFEANCHVMPSDTEEQATLAFDARSVSVLDRDEP